MVLDRNDRMDDSQTNMRDGEYIVIKPVYR